MTEPNPTFSGEFTYQYRHRLTVGYAHARSTAGTRMLTELFDNIADRLSVLGYGKCSFQYNAAHMVLKIRAESKAQVIRRERARHLCEEAENCAARALGILHALEEPPPRHPDGRAELVEAARMFRRAGMELEKCVPVGMVIDRCLRVRPLKGGTDDRR